MYDVMNIVKHIPHGRLRYYAMHCTKLITIIAMNLMSTCICKLAHLKNTASVADLRVGGGGGGSGGSIEPPFLGNSKFLQFIPPINFMYNFETSSAL